MQWNVFGEMEKPNVILLQHSTFSFYDPFLNVVNDKAIIRSLKIGTLIKEWLNKVNAISLLGSFYLGLLMMLLFLAFLDLTNL